MGLLNDSKSREKMSSLLIQHCKKIIFVSYISGIVWLALLASDVYNNKTYFSENALLPGLVIREFNPRSSLNRLLDSLKEEAAMHPEGMPSAWIQGRFRQLGLDVYQNNFTVNYPFGSKPTYKGNNLYAILRAPKTASTEALVVSTPYRDHTSVHDNTLPSIALMIELAQAFRRHTYWSKDIIFLITEYENMGFQAWLDAYHDVSTSDYIISEKLKFTSGPIQGVINLELSSYQISYVDIKVEGLHGQLPNLDFFNLVVELCNREEVSTTIQTRYNYYPTKPISWENWNHNFITMSRMILLQATGLPSGGHGLFHRFGIQALTLKSYNERNWDHDSVSLIHLGRVLEGTIRSLNNLLEKFHQSFFFYLLPSTRSFVSIGLYMPPFVLIALPVLIKALYLHLVIHANIPESKTEIAPVSSYMDFWFSSDVFTLHLACGIAMLFSPMYLDNIKPYFSFPTEDLLYYTLLALIFVWFVLTYGFNTYRKFTDDEFSFKMCTVLILLGGVIFTLSLVNISYALIFTLLYTPISVSLQYRGKLSFLQHLYLLLINPFVVTFLIVVAQSYATDSSVVWWTHFARGIAGHKKLILYTVEDMYFFGNWNYKIATLISFPLWFNLWSLKMLKLH